MRWSPVMADQLSMLDTMFLELEQVDAGAHMHIGAAMVFDPLPGGGTPGIDQVRAHIRARSGALPRFGQRLSGMHAGSLTWLTWEDDEQYDPDAHVQHATLPAPGAERELRAWLADFWSHRLDRSRPLWEMTLLDGLEGGRWALVTKTHHCLADGVGSIDIGHVLLDLAPDAPPPQATPQAAAGNGREHSWLAPVRAGLGAVRHPRTSVDHLRAAAELVVRDELIAAPATSLNQPTSATRDFAAVRFDLADIKDIKDRLGGTVNDVVLAICTGALRHLLLARGEDPPAGGLRAQVPVNIRPQEREHALGNELTSLFVELPVAEPDPAARYFRVVERAAELKAGSQRDGGRTIVGLANLGPPLAGNLLARSMFGGSRMFNLTITNVPGPQQRLYAFGAPMVEVLPFVPLFSGHTVGIAVASYAGRIVFGLDADRTEVADLDTLAEGVERSFRELFD
jgi:WS/DGAT/MGAT family acyltransferase